jgi:hypothetical protein
MEQAGASGISGTAVSKYYSSFILRGIEAAAAVPEGRAGKGHSATAAEGGVVAKGVGKQNK